MPCSPSPPRPFLYFLHMPKSSLTHPAPSNTHPLAGHHNSFLSFLPPTSRHTTEVPATSGSPCSAPIARPASFGSCLLRFSTHEGNSDFQEREKEPPAPTRRAQE